MSDSSSAWGDKETKFFFELTPERILDAVEVAGVRCSGRALALNSMENRVYDVEVLPDDHTAKPINYIAKFYRPGRWSKEQILDEHRFLLQLVEYEIPVIAPLKFPDGSTLKTLPDANIYYTLFPKAGGRSPDELDTDQRMQVGRLIARMHNVGSIEPATHRLKLTPQTYGRDNLNYLLQANLIPENIRDSYKDLVNSICDLTEPWFEKATYQRVHGDAHFGNLIWGREGPLWVDFDDMVMGPCVQDIWLITPGREERDVVERAELLEAYEQLRPFDYSSLKLIEPLRSMRFIHFTAWIARRFDDPAFKAAFPYFGTEKYWFEKLQDLYEQKELIVNSMNAY